MQVVRADPAPHRVVLGRGDDHGRLLPRAEAPAAQAQAEGGAGRARAGARDRPEHPVHALVGPVRRRPRVALAQADAHALRCVRWRGLCAAAC